MKRTSAVLNEEVRELLEEHHPPQELWHLLENDDLPSEMAGEIVQRARPDLALLQALQVNHGWRAVLKRVIKDEFLARLRDTEMAFKQWNVATEHFPHWALHRVAHWITAPVAGGGGSRQPIISLETLSVNVPNLSWFIEFGLAAVDVFLANPELKFYEFPNNFRTFAAAVFRWGRTNIDNCLASVLMLRNYCIALNRINPTYQFTFAHSWLDTMLILLVVQFKMNIELVPMLIEPQPPPTRAGTFGFMFQDEVRGRNLQWSVLTDYMFSSTRSESLRDFLLRYHVSFPSSSDSAYNYHGFEKERVITELKRYYDSHSQTTSD